MIRTLTILPLLVNVAIVRPASAADLPFDAEIRGDELKRFYAGMGEAPSWEKAVQQLSQDDPAKAKAAGLYLVALATRTLADETSGEAPWRAVPYWGGGGENPARNLRERMIDVVSELDPKAIGETAVPVLQWFIRHERVTGHRATAVATLVKLESAAADALVRSLAGDRDLAHGLRAAAIKRAAERKLDLPDEALKSALLDHHADLRAAAEGFWKAMRTDEPPVHFDAVEAIRSQPAQAFLERLAGLVWDLPPPGSPAVRVEQRWAAEDEDKKETVVSHQGWALSRDENALRLLDLHGRVMDFRLGKSAPDANDWRGPSETSVKERPAAELVAEISKLREVKDPEHQLSQDGGFTGQFQSHAAGLPEMLLACQLHRAGEADLCARILFPALDGYPEDLHFFEVVKERLSNVYGNRMLVAFVGRRDYAEALAIAARIDRDFKESYFHSHAKRLLKDLPGRADDFRSLTLPTREAWEAWRKDHSREEQIVYLCQRLRLMNCYQYGQPSDVELFDTQYAEPGGLSLDASYGGGGGKTQVINPLVELLGSEPAEGEEEEEVEEDGKEKPVRVPGLKPGIRDIPVIAPFLRDDHLILAVGFWRTFHPSRTLTGTREILAWVLERAAKREVVNHREWAALDEAELTKRIEALAAWAKERGDKSENELLLEGLKDLGDKKASWNDAWDAAEELVKRGERGAFPLIASWLAMEETSDYEIEHILSSLRKLDAKQAVDLAMDRLASEMPGIRLEAGLILLEAGEHERALPVIGEVFAKADYSNMGTEDLAESTAILAKENSPASWEAIARLFDDIGIASSDFDNVPLCRQLEARGNAAGLRHYRALLDNRDTGIPNMVGWGRVIAHMFGDKLLEGYAEHDRAAKKILADTKPDTEERLTATKLWLDARLRKLEK